MYNQLVLILVKLHGYKTIRLWFIIIYWHCQVFKPVLIVVYFDSQLNKKSEELGKNSY